MTISNAAGPGVPPASQAQGFIFNTHINYNVNLATNVNAPHHQPGISLTAQPSIAAGSQAMSSMPGVSRQGLPPSTPVAPLTPGGMGNAGANTLTLNTPSTSNANAVQTPMPTPPTSNLPSAGPKRARMKVASKQPRKTFPATPSAGETPQSGRKRGRGDSGKKPRKRYRAKGPTRLRKGRNVVTEVPMDVWELVLSYCPTKFLAKARRINKDFHQALQYESAWRRNRLQLYGPDMPGPLPDMKEDEYANLLHGLGCMDCGTAKTRRTYWLWRRRWCVACYKKNTVEERIAGDLVNESRLILDAVPFGWADAWGHYVAVTVPAGLPPRHNNFRLRIFGRADLAKTMAEWEEMKKTCDGETEEGSSVMRQWSREKEAARTKLAAHIQSIEDWVERRAREKQEENAIMKSKRAQFFVERAEKLDPPLGVDELALIPAYNRAIEVTRKPTERAWRALLPKLRQDAEAAQQVVADRRHRARAQERMQRERNEYRRRQDRRAHGDTIEQQLLVALAVEVLDDLEDASPAVADRDYPLLGLHAIRRKYYEMADAYEAEHGRPVRYRLLLEDARWLFGGVIGDRMSSWGATRSLAAKRFKCPGCTRLDMHKRHSFEGLFFHLRAKHAGTLGDFRSLMREGLEDVALVRWLDLEWPARLPVLAEHHPATGRWNPNDDAPYQRYVPQQAPTGTSIFEGRHVATDGGPSSADIVPNIVYAGELFRDTPLNAGLKTSIVFRYAVEKRRAGLADPDFCPPIAEIEGLPVALMQAGLFDLFDRCRCAACVGASGSLARDTTKLHTAGTLINHFVGRHTPNKEWSTDMMIPPDWVEVAQILHEPNMAEALAVLDRLFPLGPEASATSTQPRTTSEGPNAAPRKGSSTRTEQAPSPASGHGFHASSPDRASTTSLGFSSPVSDEGASQESTLADEMEVDENPRDAPSRTHVSRGDFSGPSPGAGAGASADDDAGDDKLERFGHDWKREMKRLFSKLADQQELEFRNKRAMDDGAERDKNGDRARQSTATETNAAVTMMTTSTSMELGMDGASSPMSNNHGGDHAQNEHQEVHEEEGEEEEDDDSSLMDENAGEGFDLMVE